MLRSARHSSTGAQQSQIKGGFLGCGRFVQCDSNPARRRASGVAGRVFGDLLGDRPTLRGIVALRALWGFRSSWRLMPYGQVEVWRVCAFVRLFVCSFVCLFVLPSDPDGVKQISQYYRGMATGRVNRGARRIRKKSYGKHFRQGTGPRAAWAVPD